jgi:hypothetical protein
LGRAAIPALYRNDLRRAMTPERGIAAALR